MDADPDRKRTLSVMVREAVECLSSHGFDWDGNEGLPMREDVLNAIHRVCDSVVLERKLPKPSVELLGDGTVEIEFRNARRTLILTFACVGVVTYGQSTAARHHGRPSPGGDIVGIVRFGHGDVHFDDIARLIDWLMEKS